MGFELKENFNVPYKAVNISDFWDRWHISLSTWLRDYVYISLGGNRKGEWKKYRNLLITFLVSGIWHGANLTFIVWGALHGIYSVLHNVISKKWKPATGKVINGIKMLGTFLIVDFTKDKISYREKIVKSPLIVRWVVRRLQNATNRINTVFFVLKTQITPHRIWYNRVDEKTLYATQERSYSDTYDTIQTAFFGRYFGGLPK